MLGDSETLRRNATFLEEASRKWWDATTREAKDEIRLEIEYYLRKVKEWARYFEDEIRTVYKKPPTIDAMYKRMKRVQGGV